MAKLRKESPWETKTSDSARTRLARNVRLLLAREGWNQLELAQSAGLSQGMISQLLAGEKGVRLSTLDRVAAALHVDVGALFAPIPSGLSLDSDGLDTAVRSAVARMTLVPEAGDAAAATRSSRAVLIDPDELREIGLAIGRAIVEATQHVASTGGMNVERTNDDDVGPGIRLT
jgi:transcriptional regulator with XRE-family HTH domain